MQKLIYNLIILGLGLYVIALHADSKLRFYIHPRYELFTFGSAIMAAIIATAAIGLTLREVHLQGKKKKLNWRKELKQHSFWAKLALVALPLLIGLLLPVKPLSSSTANQRDLDLNSLAGRELSSVDIFATDTKKYTLGEWVIALNTEPDLEDYAGKEVAVDGFIYAQEGLPNNQFLLSRFAITCCAVDASPVGLVVRYDWRGKYKQDDWLKINGRFAIDEATGTQMLVIVPEDVNKISVPDNPYVY